MVRVMVVLVCLHIHLRGGRRMRGVSRRTAHDLAHGRPEGAHQHGKNEGHRAAQRHTGSIQPPSCPSAHPPIRQVEGPLKFSGPYMRSGPYLTMNNRSCRPCAQRTLPAALMIMSSSCAMRTGWPSHSSTRVVT